MKSFRDAALHAAQTGRTDNGMLTHLTSGHPLLDLFAAIGSSRGKDIRSLFRVAYTYDPTRSLKLLLWARDIRGGAGERQTARSLLQELEMLNPDAVIRLLP